MNPRTSTFQLSTLIRRAPDGWIWRVRFNGRSWQGGPLATRQAAWTAIWARVETIRLTTTTRENNDAVPLQENPR